MCACPAIESIVNVEMIDPRETMGKIVSEFQITNHSKQKLKDGCSVS